MSREDLLREEQGETARELAELLRITQEMGRRLCNETHGDMYDEVRLLMSLLHQTRAQADFLVASQCDCLQGYLFSRPEPLQGWLTRQLGGG